MSDVQVMATSPSIETQIDSFLEQFKRSASKAMEERVEWQDANVNSVVRSRSSCFNLENASGKSFLIHYSSISQCTKCWLQKSGLCRGLSNWIIKNNALKSLRIYSLLVGKFSYFLFMASNTIVFNIVVS